MLWSSWQRPLLIIQNLLPAFDALENETGFDSAEARGRGQQDPFNVVLSEMVSQREMWGKGLSLSIFLYST